LHCAELDNLFYVISDPPTSRSRAIKSVSIDTTHYSRSLSLYRWTETIKRIWLK